SLERFEPGVARTLRSMSAAALRRLPSNLLDETLTSLGDRRAALLRRVRRRPVGAEPTPAATPAAASGARA
ncbi:glycosyltransferase family 2 protein, partial [Streptomyces sp. SID8455]|nr:glycosyltransferase family 2 protein [Streptomyces sp. SID8455]